MGAAGIFLASAPASCGCQQGAGLLVSRPQKQRGNFRFSNLTVPGEFILVRQRSGQLPDKLGEHVSRLNHTLWDLVKALREPH